MISTHRASSHRPKGTNKVTLTVGDLHTSFVERNSAGNLQEFRGQLSKEFIEKDVENTGAGKAIMLGGVWQVPPSARPRGWEGMGGLEAPSPLSVDSDSLEGSPVPSEGTPEEAPPE